MIFYDYKCPKCGTVEEYREKAEDKVKPHPCPKCETDMVRAIASVNFGFVQHAKNYDMKHSERRRKWNSGDTKELMDLTY